MQEDGRIERKFGEISIENENEDHSPFYIHLTGDEKEKIDVDAIMLACGLEPDYLAHHLVQIRRFPHHQ